MWCFVSHWTILKINNSKYTYYYKLNIINEWLKYSAWTKFKEIEKKATVFFRFCANYIYMSIDFTIYFIIIIYMTGILIASNKKTSAVNISFLYVITYILCTFKKLIHRRRVSNFDLSKNYILIKLKTRTISKN